MLNTLQLFCMMNDTIKILDIEILVHTDLGRVEAIENLHFIIHIVTVKFK